MICPRCGHDNLPGIDVCRHCQCDLTALDRPEPHDRAEQSLMTDTVACLNPPVAKTIIQTGSIAEAVQMLVDAEVGALLVTDESGRVVGIFSERDMLTRVAGNPTPFQELKVEEFMTPRPETVRPSDLLSLALHKMDVGGYRHLPVVEAGRPVGILSVRDLVRHMTRLCATAR